MGDTRKAQRRTLRWAQGSVCAGCGKHLPSAGRVRHCDPDYPTFDHVVPRSKGGTNRLENGILKHRLCNERRKDAPPTGCDLIWLAFVQARLAERPASVKAATDWRGLMKRRNGAGASFRLTEAEPGRPALARTVKSHRRATAQERRTR